MKTPHLIMIGILGSGLGAATADAQPSDPGKIGYGQGPGLGQRFIGRGMVGQALSPDVREKLKNAATKAKEDPAVKAARDKLRGGDRRAAFEECRKAYRDALIKADPSLEEPLKKIGPMMRHQYGKGAFRDKGPRNMLGQGPGKNAGPYGGNPAWGGGQGFQYRRGWGQMPQWRNPGFRGGQGFQQRRGLGQQQQGFNPQWGPAQPGPNCPRGYCPPQPPQRGYGRGWQGQVPQAPPPQQGWQQRGPQGRGPGWGTPPHRGGPPWQGPNFQ